MRRWVVETIKLDPVITSALGDGDPVAGQAKILSAGAAGLPGQVDLQPPFMIVRALDSLPALPMTNVEQMLYLIWIHDEQGSFELIGTVLSRLKQILPTKDPRRLSTGEVLMECVWQFDSGDQFDDGFDTATRYGQYQVTARRP